MSPWKISFDQLFLYAKTISGEGLVNLLTQLVGAHAWRHHIPLSQVCFAHTVNLQDGGIDGVTAHPIEEPLGYFKHPAVWQLKSGRVGKADMLTEVQKPGCLSRLKAGYGYVLVSLHKYPAGAKQGLKDQLEQAVASVLQLQPTDPRPFCEVILPEQLISWIEMYPRICLNFHHALADVLCHMTTWEKQVRSRTPRFVKPKNWEVFTQRILRHTDLRQPTLHPVLSVQGPPGCGKTRKVFEALKTNPDLEQVTVYLDQPAEVARVINHLRNQEQASGVIVVDNCTMDQVVMCKKLLQGHQDRIRLLTLGEVGPPGSHGLDVIQLQPPPNEERWDILEHNFRQLSTEQVLFILDEAGEWVSLGVELAAELSAGIHPPLSTLYEASSVLHRMLPDPDDRAAVYALALVGTLKKPEEHLMGLCQAVELSPRDVHVRLDRLSKNLPFVDFGAHGWRITPPLLADAAFEQAEKHWLGPYGATERKLPAPLLWPFLNQASRKASGSLRKRLGQWESARLFQDLPAFWRDSDAFGKLATLITLDPHNQLPRVRFLAREKFRALPAHEHPLLYGKRAEEWMQVLRRCAAYPEFFADAVHLLLEMAVHDPCKELADLARQELLNIFMLNSQLNTLLYTERLKVLIEVLEQGSPQEKCKVLQVLQEVLSDDRTYRLIGGAKIGGGYPPLRGPMPLNQEVTINAVLVWEVLLEQTRSPDPVVAEQARRCIKRTFQNLDPEKTIWTTLQESGLNLVLSEEELQQIKDSKSMLLGNPRDWPGEPAELPAEWPKLSRAEKFQRFADGNLIVSHQKTENPVWKALLEEMCLMLTESKEAFHTHARVLEHTTSHATGCLAEFLAQQDLHGIWLQEVLNRPALLSSVFGPQLVRAVLNTSDQHDRVVQAKMKRLELENPALALDLLWVSPVRFGGFKAVVELSERTGAQVSKVRFLDSLGVLQKPEFPLLAFKVLQEKNQTGLDWLMQVLHLEFSTQEFSPQAVEENEGLLRVVESVVEQVLSAPGPVKGKIGSLLPAYGAVLPAGAINRVLQGCAVRQQESEGLLEQQLQEWASQHPIFLMESLGCHLLEGTFTEFRVPCTCLSHLPLVTIKSWLDTHGEAGAVALAAFLPKPSFQGGKPEVPLLTRQVLNHWGNHPQVIERFINGVNGYGVHPVHGQPIHRVYLNDRCRVLSQWAARLDRLT